MPVEMRLSTPSFHSRSSNYPSQAGGAPNNLLIPTSQKSLRWTKRQVISTELAPSPRLSYQSSELLGGGLKYWLGLYAGIHGRRIRQTFNIHVVARDELRCSLSNKTGRCFKSTKGTQRVYAPLARLESSKTSFSCGVSDPADEARATLMVKSSHFPVARLNAPRLCIRGSSRRAVTRRRVWTRGRFFFS
jgi:hypothetical protein